MESTENFSKESKIYEDVNKREEKFRLGVLPFDPLFVYIGLIYSLTK